MLKTDMEKYEIASKLLEEGNYKEAFENYLTLAETGDIHAQVMVGWLYEMGRGSNQDIDKARFWYSKAANMDSLEGQFYLGSLYRLERKYSEAMIWLEKAAAYMYGPALYRLGKMYELGEGVSIDKEKAIKYLEDAARQGHLFAKRELSIKMLRGELGIMSTFKGLLMFLNVLILGIKLGWREPYSDRLLK
jgi:TPR repeat protein